MDLSQSVVSPSTVAASVSSYLQPLFGPLTSPLLALGPSPPPPTTVSCSCCCQSSSVSSLQQSPSSPSTSGPTPVNGFSMTMSNSVSGTNSNSANTSASTVCGCRCRTSRATSPPVAKKKSWSELKQVVSELRRQIMTLSTMVPINVTFRTLSDGRVRVYFLSTPPNGYESTLLYTDVNPNAPPTCLTSSTSSSSSEISTASSEPATGGTAAPGTSPPLHQQLLNGSLELASELASSLTAATTTLSTFGESVMNAAVGLSNSDPDLPEPAPRPMLRWNQVLEPTIASLNNNNAPGSREVQLLLERKRLSMWGITSFELHKQSGKIVYPASSTLYQCLDTGFTKGPIFPSELRLSPLWAAFDPQICPHNSDLVAYVCGGDIWVSHTVSGHVERLTYAHDGRRSFADDPLSVGVPSYVILEEFNRYQGFWWQPNSDDRVYRIAYEEVDESDVGLFTFPTSVANSGEDYEEYRFPRAGTPNAKSKLKLVEFRLSETLHIADVCIKDLHCPLSYAFPWMEYLVRVGWTPDSKFVWAQLLNRRQSRLDIVLIPLDNFCEHYSSPSNSPGPGSNSNSTTTATTGAASAVGTSPMGMSSSGGGIKDSMDGWKSPLERKRFTPIQVIYSQVSDTWVNVHNILNFLEVTDTSCTFVWASEDTGFRHLYLITSAIDLDATQTQLESNILKNHLVEGGLSEGDSSLRSHEDQEMDGSHGSGRNSGGRGKDLLIANVINKVALTDGDWEVDGQKVWIDKQRQLVYFQGLKHSPLEKHLYAVSLQQPCHIRWLTAPGSSYTVHFNEDCSIFMQTFCNIHSLPTCEIMKVDQTCDFGGVNGLQLQSLGYLLKGGAPENYQYCPTIYTEQLKDGSETIYAMVFKPHNFRLGMKYPTVLNVYGGPEVQVVNNTFKGIRQMRLHMLAAQGYCVVCIDSRGSHHRGTKFEGYLRKRMGTVELADQVEILQKLSNQLGYIDMKRVAIHGWSYGGYLSLMGLVQYADVFKLAIAGAPVTSWEYYDTGYTERYMDLPENNSVGYHAGSVLNYVQKFPDEENRLLIIHGLIDENVHFYHTSQLVNALVRLNKPYQLQVYPTERHSLRNLEASKHYETTLLSFLQNYL